MRCLECPHRRTVSRGIIAEHQCGFTGAQVASFATVRGGEGPDHEPTCNSGRDDPDLYCPVALPLRRGDCREQVLGVLRQIRERGMLSRLLACYDWPDRRRIQELLSSTKTTPEAPGCSNGQGVRNGP